MIKEKIQRGKEQFSLPAQTNQAIDSDILSKIISRRQFLVGVTGATSSILLACLEKPKNNRHFLEKNQRIKGYSSERIVTMKLSQLELGLFEGINDQRLRHGLIFLALDLTLMEVARLRSSDMANQGYFSHTSPEGQSAFSLIDFAGYNYDFAGENLARNNYPLEQSVDVALRDLMASDGHRANILSQNYDRVGIAHAIGLSEMSFFVMIFAQYK